MTHYPHYIIPLYTYNRIIIFMYGTEPAHATNLNDPLVLQNKIKRKRSRINSSSITKESQALILTSRVDLFKWNLPFIDDGIVHLVIFFFFCKRVTLSCWPKNISEQLLWLITRGSLSNCSNSRSVEILSDTLRLALFAVSCTPWWRIFCYLIFGHISHGFQPPFRVDELHSTLCTKS